MSNAFVAFKGNNLSPPMSLNRGIQTHILKVFMKKDGIYFLDIESLVELNITKAVAPELYESPSSVVSNITKPKSEPSGLIAVLGDKIAPVLAILDSGADDSWLGSNIPDELVHSKSDGCALKAVGVTGGPFKCKGHAKVSFLDSSGLVDVDFHIPYFYNELLFCIITNIQ